MARKERKKGGEGGRNTILTAENAH